MLHTELEPGEPVSVLTLAGPLERRSGAGACQAAIDALSDSPGGLVVDLRGMEVGPGAGEALLPLAKAVRAWPDRVIALCNRPVTLRPPAVSIFASRELASGYVRDFVPPPQRSQQLDRAPAASREARALVTRACSEWHHDELLPSAQLVITELVNNAVLHTSAHFLVYVTLTDTGLHLAVRDTSRSVPRMRAPEQVGPDGGQGLTLVNAFASAWGATLVPDGKVVWAELAEKRTGQGGADRAADPTWPGGTVVE
jgi:hypothetical protein